ncbi:hypothetical protein AB0N62_41655, partial [Streptomyces sp. NPDC093982]|uniref:hypothetical protein n=1 Tax=Streptomyces sp. NPDC093982 TaxID=3155077 RepID=UPI00344612BB
PAGMRTCMVLDDFALPLPAGLAATPLAALATSGAVGAAGPDGNRRRVLTVTDRPALPERANAAPAERRRR